jgi:hypothetical protein
MDRAALASEAKKRRRRRRRRRRNGISAGAALARRHTACHSSSEGIPRRPEQQPQQPQPQPQPQQQQQQKKQQQKKKQQQGEDPVEGQGQSKQLVATGWGRSVRRRRRRRRRRHETTAPGPSGAARQKHESPFHSKKDPPGVPPLAASSRTPAPSTCSGIFVQPSPRAPLLSRCGRSAINELDTYGTRRSRVLPFPATEARAKQGVRATAAMATVPAAKCRRRWRWRRREWRRADEVLGPQVRGEAPARRYQQRHEATKTTATSATKQQQQQQQQRLEAIASQKDGTDELRKGNQGGSDRPTCRRVLSGNADAAGTGQRGAVGGVRVTNRGSRGVSVSGNASLLRYEACASLSLGSCDD